jgi:hypothetical protein
MKFLQIFKGQAGEVSSKRVVGVIGALVLFGTMVANSFSPVEVAPSPELVSAVEWVTIMCLGFTSVEKFAKGGTKES